MNIAYFPNQIARNAPAVLDAFLSGCAKLGHTVVANSMSAEAAVIWSQVWHGKMRGNHAVWQEYRRTNRKVFVLEVGNFNRGTTWRLGLNGVNGTGYFGATGQDSQRACTMGLSIKPWRDHGNYVLICPQRADSEQWQGQPTPEAWTDAVITKIKMHSIRPIVVRPHPRYRFTRTWPNVSIHQPSKLLNTYDSYNFDSALEHAWAVVNWNSGPGVEAVMNGIPVFVGASSLAAPVGNNDLSFIENPLRPNRQQWLNDLAYTEWTLEEIAQGLPLQRLI